MPKWVCQRFGPIKIVTMDYLSRLAAGMGLLGSNERREQSHVQRPRHRLIFAEA